MAAQQQDADADELVRDVQCLTRSHRELTALLGEVVDATEFVPDGSAVAHLSRSLIAELRRRTGR